jgi:O-antigen/teichoic acid export membrane protein
MSDLKSTILNAGWLLSDRIVRLALNLVAGILIARSLGPEDFGLLSYGQALFFLIMPLATIGLPEIVVRELSRRTEAEQESERQEIVASALAIRALGALTSTFVMIVLAFVAAPDDAVAKIVIILYGFSIAPLSLDVFESALQSKGLFKVVSLTRTVNSVVFATIRIASVFLHSHGLPPSIFWKFWYLEQRIWSSPGSITSCRR